jgi:hypothetical protein
VSQLQHLEQDAVLLSSTVCACVLVSASQDAVQSHAWLAGLPRRRNKRTLHTHVTGPWHAAALHTPRTLNRCYCAWVCATCTAWGTPLPASGVFLHRAV